MIFTFTLENGHRLQIDARHIIASVGTDREVELIAASGHTWRISIAPGLANRGTYLEWLAYSKH